MIFDFKNATFKPIAKLNIAQKQQIILSATSTFSIFGFKEKLYPCKKCSPHSYIRRTALFCKAIR